MTPAAPARRQRATLLALVAALLAACGQTGPLYLPQDETGDTGVASADEATEEESADEERSPQ